MIHDDPVVCYCGNVRRSKSCMQLVRGLEACEENSTGHGGWIGFPVPRT